MKIILTAEEVESAVKDHLRSMGYNFDEKTLKPVLDRGHYNEELDTFEGYEVVLTEKDKKK